MQGQEAIASAPKEVKDLAAEMYRLQAMCSETHKNKPGNYNRARADYIAGTLSKGLGGNSKHFEYS